MGRTFKNVCVVIVLIISLVLLLGSSFDLFLEWDLSGYTADINNGNVEYIESQLKYWADKENRDEVPDMQDAVRISYLVFFDDYEFKVEFIDEREYTLLINAHWPEELLSYIKSEGYNSYLHSDEFIADAVLPTFSACVFVLCIVYRKKLKKVSEKSEEE